MKYLFEAEKKDVCRAVQLSTRESKFNQFRKSFLNKFSSQTFYCLSIEFGRHLTKRMCINDKFKTNTVFVISESKEDMKWDCFMLILFLAK